MATVESSALIEGKHEAGARVEVLEVESPAILARQAIGVFDSGSGGMVAAAYLSRILRDAGERLSVVFFGDTANLPYGKKTEQEVALLSDSIIGRLAPSCPVIGIACNTPSASSYLGYFAFSGDRPPEETFKALGLEQVVLAKHL